MATLAPLRPADADVQAGVGRGEARKARWEGGGDAARENEAYSPAGRTEAQAQRTGTWRSHKAHSLGALQPWATKLVDRAPFWTRHPFACLVHGCLCAPCTVLRTRLEVLRADGGTPRWPPAGYFCCGEVYARGSVWDAELQTSDANADAGVHLAQEPLWCLLVEATCALPHAALANRRLVRKKYRLSAEDGETRHVNKLTAIADGLFCTPCAPRRSAAYAAGQTPPIPSCRLCGGALACCLVPWAWPGIVAQASLELEHQRAKTAGAKDAADVPGLLAVHMHTGLLVTTSNLRSLAGSAGVPGADMWETAMKQWWGAFGGQQRVI